LNFEDDQEAESSNLSESIDLDSSALFDEDVKEQGLFLTDFFSAALKKSQTQLVEIKRRLLAEKKKELQVRDVFYTDQMRKQQSLVNKLSENLAICEKHNERNLARFDIMAERLAKFCEGKKILFSAKQSVLKVFGVFRENLNISRRNKMIFKLADSKRRKAMLAQTFLMWAREHLRLKAENSQAVLDIQHDTVVKELVKKYEIRLGKLQSELDEAHAVTRKEQMRRQQLEEDLRRTFLKNMTTLNMEALSIFQTSFDEAVVGDDGSKSAPTFGDTIPQVLPPSQTATRGLASSRLDAVVSSSKGERPRTVPPRPIPAPSK
jgi:hypothetical protein